MTVREFNQSYGSVVRRFSKENDQLASLSQEVVEDYVSYMYLTQFAANLPVPSDSVDKLWHTHLIFNRSYAEFCNRISGNLIYHEPQDEDFDPSSETATISKLKLLDLARQHLNYTFKTISNNKHCCGNHCESDNNIRTLESALTSAIHCCGNHCESDNN